MGTGIVGGGSYRRPVRILHTSDWHLGRSFHREGMLTHQAAYVDHLLEVVESERVDLVLVAGDVYDRALPPVDAVRLADETLVRLAHSRARVVVTSGNHDSAQRLGFSARLIDAAGVFIRTDASAVGTPVVLADEHGPVAVYGLPYLDPLALAEPWELPVRSHEAALAEAMDRVRRDLATRSPGTRSVVVAHAFVAGGQPSESERDISVGGVARVATSVLDGVDYAALGHLHGAQTLTRAGPLQRVAARLLLLRARADARVPGWSTSRPTARWRRRSSPRRCRERWPGSAASSSPCSRTLPWPSTSSAGCRRPSPTACGPASRWSVCGGGSRTPWCSPSSPATDPSEWCPPLVPARAPTTTSPSTSSRELRGAPATAAESALLQQACDACRDDTDVDTLLSPAGGGR